MVSSSTPRCGHLLDQDLVDEFEQVCAALGAHLKGRRKRMIWARVGRPWTSIPAGMSLASGTAPSAVTSSGHCTESGSVGSIRGSVDRDIEVGDAVVPTLIDVGERLERVAVEVVGPAGVRGHRLGQQWCPQAATATVSSAREIPRRVLSPAGWFRRRGSVRMA